MVFIELMEHIEFRNYLFNKAIKLVWDGSAFVIRNFYHNPIAVVPKPVFVDLNTLPPKMVWQTIALYNNRVYLHAITSDSMTLAFPLFYFTSDVIILRVII